MPGTPSREAGRANSQLDRPPDAASDKGGRAQRDELGGSPEQAAAGCRRVPHVRTPRGTGSPRHRHHNEDEAWYVIDGELAFWLGGVQHTAGAGCFVFGPREVEHRFEVLSTEARFLILVTPSGFEEFTRICGDPATALTTPPPNLPAASRRGVRSTAYRRRLLTPRPPRGFAP